MPVYTSSLKASSGSTVSVPLSRTPELYTVTSGQQITFTTCGQTGRMGPTLAQARSSYASEHAFASWGNNIDLFMVDLGVQYWTVPKTGSYTITAAGAAGGNQGGQGYGAVLTSSFDLEAGDTLRIIVGQRGNADGTYAGAGGGSAVAVLKYGMMTLLIVGAGGAGVSGNDNSTGNRASYRHARINDSAGLFGSGNYPGKGSVYQNGYSSYIANYWYGGGGGAWGKDGMRGGIGYWHREKCPVQNEGKALDNIVPYGGTSAGGFHGGFGGGGATGTGSGAGAGGGGYQGGNSQYINGNATVNDTGNTQGGGSYSLNATSSTSSGESGNNAEGYVRLTMP